MDKKVLLTFAAFAIFCNIRLIAQPTSIDNNLHLNAIPNGLHWINPPGSFEITDSVLTIVPHSGTDLFDFAGGGFSKHNAPMLLFYPDSNFVFTAKINLVAKKRYDGASLVIFSDTAHWAKLLLEYKNDSLYIVCTNVTNVVTDDNYNLRCNQPQIYFRVGKSANLFTMYYSLNGLKWEIIRAFAFNSTVKTRIGFSAQSPDGNGCKAVFSGIKYKGKAFSNYFTGE